MGQRRVSFINIMAINGVSCNFRFKCSDCSLLLVTAQWLFYVTVCVCAVKCTLFIEEVRAP